MPRMSWLTRPAADQRLGLPMPLSGVWLRRFEKLDGSPTAAPRRRAAPPRRPDRPRPDAASRIC